MATNSRDIGELTKMIATEIRSQRDARGLTMEQVFAVTRIPVNTLSKIERAQTAIDVEQIEKIANAFGMLPEVLWAEARRSAKLRAGEIYRADGTLDPMQVRGFKTSEAHLAELAERERSGPSE